MFEQTSRTPFGATLTVRPSTLHYLADTCVGAEGVMHAAQVPTLQRHAPTPMLDLARTLDGSNVRLACLSADEARIGAAMAYLPGHFAIAMFDHGDARSKDIAEAALASGQMTILLRDEPARVAVRVRVTDLMRRVLTDCKPVPSASFAQFVECTQSLAKLSVKAVVREVLDECRLSVCSALSTTRTKVRSKPPKPIAAAPEQDRVRPSSRANPRGSRHAGGRGARGGIGACEPTRSRCGSCRSSQEWAPGRCRDSRSQPTRSRGLHVHW